MTAIRWIWRKTELWVGRAIRALERIGMIVFGTVDKLKGENEVLVYVIGIPLIAGPFIRFLRWVEPELFEGRDKDAE
ncbi:hypothetical protein LCGC14_0998840 [marine sediment metagenome]|uniref:Uncharacterized protein n=1 Tax=marine sediment metagenome TaxID=412755 RepID=A0A0F9N3J4_9ZZZZ